MFIADTAIWRAANLLLAEHGQDAVVIVAQRLDELLQRGDTKAEGVWRSIAAAIEELRRAERLPGERVN
ncbi:MAG TPA: hypothetical protein VFA22_02475 [Stellaceae bacterium]|nr:hypothetical protein [Stellaceae bacterium]